MGTSYVSEERVAKPCQYPGCDEPKAPGPGKRYCENHAVKKKQRVCRRDGCDNAPAAGCSSRYCEKCTLEKNAPKIRICLRDGCNKVRVSTSGASKYCEEHSPRVPKALQTLEMLSCKQPGCLQDKAPGTGNWYCEKHSADAVKRRSPTGVKKGKCKPGCTCKLHSKPLGTGKCKPGCECERHSLEVRARIGEANSGRCEEGCTCYLHKGKIYTISSYNARHAMVQRVRGTARKYTCVFCGKRQAKHWATIHYTDGTRPADYLPLCAKCHVKYDRIGVKSWQTRCSRYGPTGIKDPESFKRNNAAAQRRHYERTKEEPRPYSTAEWSEVVKQSWKTRYLRYGSNGRKERQK
jgi:hypothetical protein